MRNDDFNYKFQYENWHNESEESKQNDIKDSLNTIKTHNILHKDQNAKILEIGCGMGRFMLALKKLGYNNLVGLDIDKSQIEIAQKENLNVILCNAVEFFKKTEEVFDVIYCFDVLEHIKKDEQLEFFKLLNKHLSDTGFIVIRVPNALAPTASYYRYIDFTHNISYTDNTISFLAKNAGLMYIITRPTHQESKKIQKLKLPWAKLYREEFGMQNPILTPNIVSIIFKNKNTFENYLEKAPIINNCYSKIKNTNKKYPKWLINLLCCFIPKQKNRKNLRKKYIKNKDIFNMKNINIQQYQKDAIRMFFDKGYTFKDKVILEIGGSNHPSDFVFEQLEAKKWICIDLIMEYQIQNNPSHYKNVVICDINDENLENIIRDNKYIVIKGDINKIINCLINKIDVVYSVCAFEHISNLDITISNIYQYLKVGGKLYSNFGPIYSCCSGSHFWSSDENFRFNNQIKELDFLHLLYKKSDLPSLLKEKLKNYNVTQEVLEEITLYFLNNDKFVNEMFFDDYDKVMKNSEFKNSYKIIPVYQKTIRPDLLKELRVKYPNNTNFEYYSIAIFATK